MPTYEYRRPDGTTFDIVQRFADDTLTHDPETGVPVSRVLHSPAVHFKGKGFYNTDYGTRNRQREAQAEGDAQKASKDSSNGSSKSSDGGSSDSSSGGSSDSSSGGSESSSGSTKKDTKPAAQPATKSQAPSQS